MATERAFLRAGSEVELPVDPEEAALVVARHPEHEEVRVVVGVLRDGSQHGLARLASHPDDLLDGPDLVPALSAALLGTLA